MTKSDRTKGVSNSPGYALPTTIGINNHDPTMERAPGYSIGVRFQEKIRPTPGPQYRISSGLTPRGKWTSPSYSISGRPSRSVWLTGTAYNPGPNAYNVQQATPGERRAPMYSIGSPFKAPGNTAGPGPNAYNLPSTLGNHVPDMRSAPAAAMHGRGSDIKGFSYDNAKTPGPARYNPVDLSLTAARAPVVSIKSRTTVPSVKFPTPGPGAYDVSKAFSNTSKLSPRFHVGVRHGQNARSLFTLADVSD
ncbi:hypothetical protein C0Q70_11588 [Pomacea canaliculata]|uniref:Outer dense fiber protein 3 n=1 Tax=Pomacea canaliculata TaxID=400727 RepID=A0A2T7P6G4_POMCA|nr:outer dense fiber protein 3-like [Pomacea canaliculata]XP_025099589.1 outer dense fiber protein 3-like [Pomacea canaliculata]PVD28991.1 hypothetical protein C0Q70_11588 [Pomacea canaliculata]